MKEKPKYLAHDFVSGRIEYYLEEAQDQEDVQQFALEVLATSMLDLDDLQRAIDALSDDDGIQDAIADLMTLRVLRAAQAIREKLGLK
jgi:molecular chaperone GrpE (heat shock protein)